MTPKPPIHTVDALYAIGRNVVNFQHLEHLLKRLAMFAPICATPARLQSEIEKQRARVEKLTLGGAVKKWIESEFHTTRTKQASPLDQEIMISFGVELPVSPEYFDQLSGELELLAQERNSLMHQDLAQLNLEDEAECRALSIRLSAQNDRIIRATQFLGPIVAQMMNFARLIASDPSIVQELVSPTFVEKDAE